MKNGRFRERFNRPSARINFYWKHVSKHPYGLQRLWLFCCKYDFQMPNEHLTGFVQWVEKKHKNYVKKYEIKGGRPLAIKQWLECYYNKTIPESDVLEKFNEWVFKSIVAHYDDQHKYDRKRRIDENRERAEFIFGMFWDLQNYGCSKEKAKEIIADEFDMTYGAVNQSLYRYRKKRDKGMYGSRRK